MIGSDMGDGRRGNGWLSVMENIEGNVWNGLRLPDMPLGASSRSWVARGWVGLVRLGRILS